MKLKSQWFLLGVVSMAAMCAIGGVLFYAAAVAIQPAPTSTPLPPTYTPWPTATPAPTLTATPTSTSTPTAPPEVRQYASEVLRCAYPMGVALTRLDRLLVAPANHTEWRYAVAVQSAIIQAAHEKLMVLDVPLEMAKIHAALTDATGDYYTAMDYLESGLDNLDGADLEEALRLMQRADQKLGSVNEMLEEYLGGGGTGTELWSA